MRKHGNAKQMISKSVSSITQRIGAFSTSSRGATTPRIWFRDEPLSFSCTQCGKCCTGRKGKIWVNTNEQTQLADHLKINVEEFQQQYVQTEQDKATLRMKNEGDTTAHCIFWKNKQCSVYTARPTQCRTYPFWSQQVVTPYDWKVAAVECEGISVEATSALETEEVLKQVVIHGVNQSGEDTDWSHAQMEEYLEQVDGTLLDEFEQNLAENYARQTVYSDDQILVQDNYMGEHAPTRSLHFTSQIGVTQSELFLNGDGRVTFDHLALDVHRAQSLAVAWLPSALQRVAVIGTGAGALPMFLQHHWPDAHIDCVEISSHILQIAQTHFGLTENDHMHLFPLPGEDYISSLLLDLLIVDVATSSTPVIAPPDNLISHEYLLHLRNQMQPHGIVVWNLIPNDQSHLHDMVHRVQLLFPNIRLLSLPNNWILFASTSPKDWHHPDLDQYLRSAHSTLMNATDGPPKGSWHHADELMGAK